MEWNSVDKKGTALFDFTATDVPNGLSFKKGDDLVVTQDYSGVWLRGQVVGSDSVGIFPANHVSLYQEAVVRDLLSLLISESDSVLQEWAALLPDIYMSVGTGGGEGTTFDQLVAALSRLLSWRGDAIAKGSSVTYNRACHTRDLILNVMEQGRRVLTGDRVPRTSESHPATLFNTGVMKLYNLHHLSAKRDTEIEETKKKETSSKSSSSSVEEAEYALHLTHSLFLSPIPQDESVEVQYSLVGNGGNLITEQFSFLLNSSAYPTSKEFTMTDGSVPVLFTGLTRNDFRSGVNVMCRVVRKGRMLDDVNAKEQKTKNSFRRPLAVATEPITCDALLDDEKEVTMMLYAPLQDHEWAALPATVLKRDMVACKPVPRSTGVCAKFRMHPISAVDKDPSLLTLPRAGRLSFPDVILPSLHRNDLYLTLNKGEFAMNRRTAAQNIECYITIRNFRGEPIHRALASGVADKMLVGPDYESMVYYHNNSPVWEEHVKVTIPEARFVGCHVLMEFRHCSTKNKGTKADNTFALAYLPLADGGTAIADGKHVVKTYKPVKAVKHPAYYLNTELAEMKPLVERKEQITITTKLLSTVLTQSPPLRHIFDWKNHGEDELKDILERFTYIEQVEIIKFVREIFDALFSIMDAYPQHASIVFDALVFIVGIVTDEKSQKFNNFRPVLEAYVQSHLASPTAHTHLLACLSECLDPSSGASGKRLRSSIKSLEFLLRFVVRSHELGSKKSPIEDPEFVSALIGVFEKLSTLMAIKNQAGVIGAQTMTLKTFPALMGVIAEVMSPASQCVVIRQFLDSIPFNPGKAKLMRQKLAVIRTVVTGSLMLTDESREVLLPEILRQLAVFAQTDLFVAALEVVGDLVAVVQDVLPEPLRPQVVGSMEPLLVILVDRCTDLLHGEPTAHRDAAAAAVANVAARASTPSPVQSTPSTPTPSAASNAQRLLSGDHTKSPARRLQTRERTMTVDSVASRRGSARGSMSVSDAVGETLLPATPESLAEVHAQVATVILALLHMTGDEALHKLLSLEGTEVDADGEDVGTKAPFVHRLLKVFAVWIGDFDEMDSPSATCGWPFAEDWFQMRMVLLQTANKVLKAASVTIPAGLSTGHYSKPLWNQVFTILTTFVIVPTLQVQGLPDRKREWIQKKFGDMRAEAAQMLTGMVASLGNRQLDFLESNVEASFSLLRLTDIPKVQSSGLNLYASLLAGEFTAEGSLGKMEGLTIKVLDTYAANGALSEEFQDFFLHNIQDCINAASTGPEFLAATEELMTSVRAMLGLMVSLESIPDTPGYEDSRAEATLRLMAHFLSCGRTDLYVRYLSRLTSLHLSHNRQVEAGLSDLLQADLLEWDETPVKDTNGAATTALEYRAEIYERAVARLVAGKWWERAIELYDDLIGIHRFEKINYAMLSQVLAEQSKLFSLVATEERLYPSYYRVGFYGRGFHESLSNRVFVYRGEILEQLPAFTAKIASLFPGVEVVKKLEEPDEEYCQSDKMAIQVVTVYASSERALNGLEGPDPDLEGKPEATKKHSVHDDVSVFNYSRPFRKGAKSGNEFKDLWLEEKYLVCEHAFPHAQRRSPVQETVIREVAPLLNAVNMMAEKTREVEAIIDSFYKPGAVYQSPLTMALNGIVDAAVNGGIKNYELAFFCPEYLKEDPECRPVLKRFNNILRQQLVVVKRGVEIHGKLRPEAMAPMHEHITSVFVKFTADLEAGILSFDIDQEV